MTNKEAVHILRNTAWLGSNKDREKVEEAIETLAVNTEQPEDRCGERDAWNQYKNYPSAQPTLHGYNIEHLELIAIVLQKENLPPERIVEALTDIGGIVAIVRDEFEETLRKAVEQCTI